MRPRLTALILVLTACVAAVQADVDSWRATYRRADIAGLAEQCRQAIGEQPDAAEAHAYLALALAEAGDIDGATAAAERAIELDPGLALAHLMRARIRHAGEDQQAARAAYEECLTACGKAVEANPTDPWPRVVAAMVFRSAGDPEKATAHATGAAEVDGTCAEAFYERAMAEKKADSAAAIGDLTRAIEADPRYTRAYMERGILRGNAGALDEALADLTEAIGANGSYAPAYLGRANLLMTLDRPMQAIDDYGRAIELSPRTLQAYIGRARALASRGQTEAAKADYDSAIALSHDTAVLYVARARMCYAMGDWEGVVADAARALTLDPAAAGARALRGLGFIGQDRLDEAAAEFNAALAARDDDHEAYFGRGRLQSKKGNLREAIGEYTKAVELEPRYVDAYLARCDVYLRDDKFKRGLEDADRALAINGNSPWAHLKRGDALIGLNRWVEAEEEYNIAKQIDPDGAAGKQATSRLEQMERVD